MTSDKKHNVQVPGAPAKDNDLERVEPIGEPDAGDASAELAAENKRLKQQLAAEKAKHPRDRSVDTGHLPEQKEYLGKQINRAVLTKDGWLPADQPKANRE